MRARIKSSIYFGIFSLVVWEVITLLTLVLPYMDEPFSGTGNLLALTVLAPTLAFITTAIYVVFECIKSYGS